MNPAVHLVIPVKNPDAAKQRLSAVLDDNEREMFFRAMVADLFAVIADCTGFASVSVVTRDDQISATARANGFDVVRESANDGHTAAVARGFSHVADKGAQAAMTLPADLPCLGVDDIDTLLKTFGRAHESIDRSQPICLLVPAADHAGTNAAILSPPDLFDFNFGDDSFYPHVDAAKRAGADPLIVENDNIGIDVDTPEDLQALVGKMPGTHSGAWLKANAQRLKDRGIQLSIHSQT